MYTLDQVAAAFLTGILLTVFAGLVWYYWPRPKALSVEKNWKPVKGSSR